MEVSVGGVSSLGLIFVDFGVCVSFLVLVFLDYVRGRQRRGWGGDFEGRFSVGVIVVQVLVVRVVLRLGRQVFVLVQIVKLFLVGRFFDWYEDEVILFFLRQFGNSDFDLFIQFFVMGWCWKQFEIGVGDGVVLGGEGVFLVLDGFTWFFFVQVCGWSGLRFGEFVGRVGGKYRGCYGGVKVERLYVIYFYIYL